MVINDGQGLFFVVCICLFLCRLDEVMRFCVCCDVFSLFGLFGLFSFIFVSRFYSWFSLRLQGQSKRLLFGIMPCKLAPPII